MASIVSFNMTNLRVVAYQMYIEALHKKPQSSKKLMFFPSTALERSIAKIVILQLCTVLVIVKLTKFAVALRCVAIPVN